MKIYTVGGAIRDELLGLPVQDRDHVVVGATPGEMSARGFRPVGKDFPVFLHPVSQEEYALARTERKTGPGYHGFVCHADPDVTLEQDLERRDLTINAMARDGEGNLFDPFGGRRDLERRVLRHVGPAFAEDPVRILRLARFAARFSDFTVAPETVALMARMVEGGEVDHLVPERVWQELSRGLMEAKPSRMIEVLLSCGALGRILPEVDCLFGVPQPEMHHPERDTGVHVLMVVDDSASRGLPLPVRFSALVHDLGKGETPPEVWPHHYGHEARSAELVEGLCRRLKVPTDCRDLALLAARYHGDIHKARELKPATVVKLLEHCDALRRPQRFADLLQVCACDFHGRPGYAERPYLPAEIFLCAQAAATAVDAGAIARATPDPAHIPERIHEARVSAVRLALTKEQA
ncbi:MAG: multifunctional CCA addition/repair protein [Rhodocyclaceae bacterium]|nr:multifunctional CCA addition/repair protein [Rhodocyclaceae bacterium]